MKEAFSAPSLSIIIPIYNVVEYIDECLESVLSQSEMTDGIPQRIEVIAVDDCSTDESAVRVLKKLDAHPQLRLIKNEINLGLGQTRNVGLDSATGSHVIFIDSDDRISDGALHRLIQLLIAFPQTDIAILEFSRISQDGKHLSASVSSVELTSTQADEKDKIRLVALPKYAWAKAYRREMIENQDMRFSTGYYEDIQWTIRAIRAANKIVKLRGAFYEYRQRENSILHTRSSKHLDFFRAYKKIFQEIDPATERHLTRALFESFISETYFLLKNAQNRIPRERINEFQQAYSQLLSDQKIQTRSIKGWIKRIWISLFFSGYIR